jgi:RNA polymerase sigma-70 factor (ECF subfamily)
MSEVRDDGLVAPAALATPAALASLVSRAHAALPGVALDADAFGAYVDAHPHGAEALASEASGGEGGVELALAFALRARQSAAHAAFESRYLAHLDHALARMRLGAAELDEVRQRVRQKLLLPGEGGALRVEEYAGRGRLAGLVHVAATREALSLLRRVRREVPAGGDDDDLAAPVGDRWDAGLELARERYKSAFRPAFADAVAALETRERNLLRLHLLGGVPLEQLASVYGVHRATVVRWLAAARARVLEGTRANLLARLAVRPDELESLMGWVQSRFDVSVERLFATQGGDDDRDDDGEG